ncbi:MAG: hypothetical protein LCH38_02580 [Proteobacteria bacterium]|nr:hypothetical protein [Pseudomonadota bacterium]
MKQLGASLLLALIAAGLTALQITLKGEIWFARTYLIVALAAFGGFVGAVASLLAFRLLRVFTRRFSGRPSAGFLFAGFFMLAMGGAYVLFVLFIAGEFEPHDGYTLRALAGAFLQVFGLFLISSPTYLLPLPLPGLVFAAARLLVPASDETVEPSAKRV